jgi:hypothetical protein
MINRIYFHPDVRYAQSGSPLRFDFNFDFYFNLIDNDEWFMTQYEEKAEKLHSYYMEHGVFR